MKEIVLTGAVAFDGTQFVGEGCKKLCEEYENDCLNKLYDEMKGHCRLVLNGENFCTGYVKIIDKIGLDQLKQWAIINNILLSNDFNSNDYGKWCQLVSDHDEYYYHVTRSLESRIKKLQDVLDELNNMNEDSLYET